MSPRGKDVGLSHTALGKQALPTVSHCPLQHLSLVRCKTPARGSSGWDLLLKSHPISRLVLTAPSTHHHVDGEGASGLEVLQSAQHGKNLVFPDLHRDQLPNENRNLDREGMGGAKPFRPALREDQLYCANARLHRLQSHPMGEGSLGAHCPSVHPAQTPTALHQHTGEQGMLLGVAKGKMTPSCWAGSGHHALWCGPGHSGAGTPQVQGRDPKEQNSLHGRRQRPSRRNSTA